MASAAAEVLTGAGLVLLFGLGVMLRKPANPLPPESATALKTKIEQLLTEARVIIPGGQALLGFQFVATLTKSFRRYQTGCRESTPRAYWQSPYQFLL